MLHVSLKQSVVLDESLLENFENEPEFQSSGGISFDLVIGIPESQLFSLDYIERNFLGRVFFSINSKKGNRIRFCF